MKDRFGAFCPGAFSRRAGALDGVLSGSRFAVKDLIDVAGHVTGGGNPDWARSHAPAKADAPVVERLLHAGAALIGKTISDELAFSLDGRNAHYGTPTNPAAPGRVPGGSSSGSAAAVAGGLVDFALGTDTGGSVRVPASFCGLFGFRPSHGAISTAGVIPFAPSFDTVGWLARDAALLAKVGGILLPDKLRTALPQRFLFCRDAFCLADPDVAERIMDAGRRITRFRATEGLAIELTGDAFAAWTDAYRILQGSEIRESLGPWIREANPTFGPNIAPRFASLQQISEGDVSGAAAQRQAARAKLDELLAEAALVLPTTPIVAPHCDIDEAELGRLYPRMLALTSPAGLAGLPQVTMPVASSDGCPIGLSLIGPRGSDRALLALAAAIFS